MSEIKRPIKYVVMTSAGTLRVGVLLKFTGS